MGGYCRDLAATSEAPRGAPGVKTSAGSDRGGAVHISLVADMPREVEEEHEHPDDNGQPNKIFMSTQTNKKRLSSYLSKDFMWSNLSDFL